jgi:hypothetical protein
MKRIKNLYELEDAVQAGQTLKCEKWGVITAVAVFQLDCPVVLALFRAGLYVYEPERTEPNDLKKTEAK